jgi:hypothetical protein
MLGRESDAGIMTSTSGPSLNRTNRNRNSKIPKILGHLQASVEVTIFFVFFGQKFPTLAFPDKS